MDNPHFSNWNMQNLQNRLYFEYSILGHTDSIQYVSKISDWFHSSGGLSAASAASPCFSNFTVGMH